MNRIRATSLVTVFFGLLASAGYATAQQQQPPPNGQRPQPPTEAFTACDGRRANDACTVSIHGRTISGTCEAFTDARLFCRPEGMPPPPPSR
jgi:hypothetical protein